MAHFEARVRVFDLIETDAAAARRTLEERLRTAGFNRWQVGNIELQRAIIPPVVAARRRAAAAQASYAGGGVMVAGVVAWALWFLWIIAG